MERNSGVSSDSGFKNGAENGTSKWFIIESGHLRSNSIHQRNTHNVVTDGHRVRTSCQDSVSGHR